MKKCSGINLPNILYFSILFVTLVNETGAKIFSANQELLSSYSNLEEDSPRHGYESQPEAYAPHPFVSSPVSDYGSILNQQYGGWSNYNDGGKAVQQVLNQKAEKVKILGNFLIQTPGQFTQGLRNKVEIATKLYHQGSRAIGSVFNFKASIAKQAADILESKEKATNAAIKSGGETAANIITWKGNGIANLITSSGKAASALFNHKDYKVNKITEIFSSLGGGWGQEGYS